MRREWIEIISCQTRQMAAMRSPSMRREWIEMLTKNEYSFYQKVSLHAEGVD